MERFAVMMVVCLLAALSGCQADAEDNRISEHEGLTGNSVENYALQELEAPAVLEANSSAAEANSEPTIYTALKQLEALEERLAASEREVSALQSTMIQLSAARQGQPQVAFSAAHPVDGTIGPVNVLYSLVYSHILYNTGGHYNSITGYFTAPVSGVYYFAIHSFYWGGSGMGGGLYRNNHSIVSWRGHSPNHASSGSNSAVVQLQAGDHINVRLWNNNMISDNVNRYCSFSGFLLFTV